MNNQDKMKELAKKYNLTGQDFWNLTGSVWIIKHDAVEKIAKMEKIAIHQNGHSEKQTGNQTAKMLIYLQWLKND